MIANQDYSLGRLVPLDVTLRVHMTDVRSHTRSPPDIVERERRDERVRLQQKGHGLTDTPWW